MCKSPPKNCCYIWRVWSPISTQASVDLMQMCTDPLLAPLIEILHSYSLSKSGTSSCVKRERKEQGVCFPLKNLMLLLWVQSCRKQGLCSHTLWDHDRRFGFLARWLQSCDRSLFPVTMLQYNSPLFDLNTCELLKGDCRPGTLSWPSPLSPHAAREAILVANTEMCPLAGKHRNPKHQISWLDKTRIMWFYNKLKPQKLTGNSTSTIMSLRVIFFQILMTN